MLHAAVTLADNVELIARRTAHDRLDLSDYATAALAKALSAAHVDAWLGYAAYRPAQWQCTLRTLLAPTLPAEVVAELDGYQRRFSSLVEASGRGYMAYLHFGTLEEILAGYSRYHQAVLHGEVEPRCASHVQRYARYA
jgi:hypothetical protein